MLTEEEKKICREWLMFLKVARRCNPILCIAMLTGDGFKENVQKFERLCGWTPEDNAAALRLAKKLETETTAHTLPEQSSKISKTLKYGGLALLAAAVVGGIVYYKKKNGDGKNSNAEK